MKSKGMKFAKKADDATNQGSALFASLSAMMCWDAVLACAHNAGILNDAQVVAMKPTNVEQWDKFVPLREPHVQTRKHMRLVPPGALLAFLEVSRVGIPRKIIHAMVSLGNGWAAGTKNNCLDIGMGVWEKHNLADVLDWRDGSFLVGGRREVMVTYRDIDAFT